MKTKNDLQKPHDREDVDIKNIVEENQKEEEERRKAIEKLKEKAGTNKNNRLKNFLSSQKKCRVAYFVLGYLKIKQNYGIVGVTNITEFVTQQRSCVREIMKEMCDIGFLKQGYTHARLCYFTPVMNGDKMVLESYEDILEKNMDR